MSHYDKPWGGRHDPESKDTMMGVASVRKHCTCCYKYRPTGGGRQFGMGKAKRFVCCTCITFIPEEQ